mmetsp:Transcript_62/g.223  ORF Transcript_62/g.223 Transcript_62/m.223 type:complete len:538 (+) Transcript_62:123-1736(+)
MLGALHEAGGLFGLVQNASVSDVREALKNVGDKFAARILNADHQTLLFSAVQREVDTLEVCKLLIDEHQVVARHADKRGQTALHYLAKCSSVDCVQLLVERRCQVDHVDRLLLQTPLFYAARYSGPEMVAKLVQFRADANFVDVHGQTPIYWTTSLDVCIELVTNCRANCCVYDALSLSVVDWHRRRSSQAVVRYLSVCSEVHGLRGRRSWAARRNGNQFSAYATTLARKGDVEQLLLLEDEFIEDHRALLTGLSENDVFKQIGLNPERSARRATIRQIVQAASRTGKIRHYTLKCVFLPPNPQDIQGPKRIKSYEVVGYVYFRACDGKRGQEGMTLPPRKGERGRRPLPGGEGYCVISHLKVRRDHQQQGVARMLLAGALRLAEEERRGFDCTQLYLSVIAHNDPAVGLYHKLGFVETGREGDQVEWLNMARTLTEESGRELSTRWLQGVSGSQITGPASARQEEAQDLSYLSKRTRSVPSDFGEDDECDMAPSAKRHERMCSSPQVSAASNDSTSAASSLASLVSLPSLPMPLTL